ncbi:hypothetical protein CWR48_06735 [Oceanobacillus arenosus]|uniref:Uncharacterized protein n=1 Tax=Oceanobacillus arenosus TaxID=1229153 RepID=A0A3D8PW92_9BACI|nr:hypothetical protein [Oceanobacillus arenosus]RDW20032.1 hypothetical protein CWR48_06735 [Oceanobacillus arenosus]
MFNEPLVAAAMIFALFAIAEIISVATKARIPMLFIVFFGYLMLLWTGVFPADIAEKSYFVPFASMLPAVLIVHMGTLIPFKQLKEQYKAVIIALSGVIVAVILVLAIVAPIIGYAGAASALGPLTGGIIAYIISAEKLSELGLVSLVTIPALILGIQNFVGMPLAAYFLRKRGLTIQKEIHAGTYQGEASKEEEQDVGEKKWQLRIPERYKTSTILLFQVFIGGAIATVLGTVTGINYSLWALAIGIIGSLIGFYPGKVMERANSFGITMALLIVVVMSSMNSITPSMFTEHLPAVIFIMVVGVIGIMVGGFFSSKLLKWDTNKGMPVALTALFGFPGDYILCEEVSRSLGKTKKEQETIFNDLVTPMLIGGFTTVTISSVVIASILMSFL